MFIIILSHIYFTDAFGKQHKLCDIVVVCVHTKHILACAYAGVLESGNEQCEKYITITHMSSCE